ncbi:MAG: hypothetical protein KUG69_04955 [Marinosulfonomonas sp.]|nr:hypothetical protein [Marinosulfonomonas sp.]
MQGSVIFDPLVAWPVLFGMAGLAIALLAYAIWGGLIGWFLRACSASVLLFALANPSFQNEDRTPLTDLILLVVDQSASQGISDRPAQIEAAIDAVTRRFATRPNTELKVVKLTDAEGDGGTLLMTRLAEALSEVPVARVAGAILLSDGQLHDLDRLPNMPAPLHLLLTGRSSDWDRRLIMRNAPAFAILGEPVTLTMRIEDQGRVPPSIGATVLLEIAVDGGEPQRFEVAVGRDIELPVTLPHGGMNVIQFTVPGLEGELTDRNNAAVVQINGVRDRLRVLLVSGEPHPGERTWRNLLKSDSSVDLVHFTILRPPEKQDRVPVSELSLIAFPTRELFLDKIDEFDLIIFDRYKRRGILPSLYLDNVRQYVEDGGAVLLAAGPDFATADSLFRSPLGEIIPAEPTSRVLEEGFRPAISELGNRHPVTEGLAGFSPETDDGPGWGRWFRLIDVVETSGHTVMTGIDERPLLVLDRVGEGRIALLASDHAWLWSRGFEGGGPQLELLRRLAHWMMKEPDLEEEALSASAEGQSMLITRRTLDSGARDVEITQPDGSTVTMSMEEVTPGRFQAEYSGPDIGLYRLSEGDMKAVVALGPSAPREFEETIATGAKLQAALGQTRGGIMALEDGFPDIRTVRPGRPAAGRGWIAYTPRDAYMTANVSIRSLIPGWVFLLVAAMLSVGAWLREGRR